MTWASPRKFVVEPATRGVMPCIQAHDMDMRECDMLRAIVLNPNAGSDDARNIRPANPCLRGYKEPGDGTAGKNGWMLIEFWTADAEAVRRAVEHVNERFAREGAASVTTDQQ